MPIKHIHDRGFKFLFANPTFLKQLLQSFVHEPWVAQLDFSTTEKVSTAFVSKAYKETIGDLMHKVKFRDQEAYIYVMFESQSTSQPFMAVRMAYALLSFYIDFIHDAEHQGKPLPLVFPIVVYNGKGQWTAPTALRDLLHHPEILGEFVPDFRFFKIAGQDYSPERLEAINNLVSTLMLADCHYDFPRFKRALLNLFDKERHEDILMLMHWFFMLMQNKGYDESEYLQLVEQSQTKQEATTMLEDFIAQERKQWMNEGEVKGQIKGEAIGSAKTAQEITRNLLLAQVDMQLIAQTTGLSIAEIMQLKTELDNEQC